jgi:hypothetical protein
MDPFDHGAIAATSRSVSLGKRSARRRLGPMSCYRLVCGTAAVVTALIGLVPSGIGATMASDGVSPKLVGRWSRNVHATTFPSGVWSMAIKKSGAVAFYQPMNSSVDFTTSFKTTDGGKVSVGTVPICPTTAVYRWKVSGARLTITKVSDTCSDRVRLYSGVWKRG